MKTLLYGANARRTNPEAAGEMLTATLLKARDAYPKAENGKHVLLSDDYAARVLADMSMGRSQEFKRIYAVCQCMLIDGIPMPLVTAALRQMLTMLEVESGTESRGVTPRMLWSAWRRETRRQWELDDAQHVAAQRPDCPNALSTALFAGENYLVAYDEWRKLIVALLLAFNPKPGRLEVVR